MFKLGDFLDRVFESLLFSYGDGKSVIQKFQKIIGCFMYTYITHKGSTLCLRCSLEHSIYQKLKQGLDFETFGSGSYFVLWQNWTQLPCEKLHVCLLTMCVVLVQTIYWS